MAMRRRAFVQLTGAALAGALPSPVASGYPSRPVRILVGFPAGGPLDIVARVVAPLLSSRLQADFLIENRPGASGNIATAAVIAADPDGHVLLLCGPVNTINTTWFEPLAFDFARDIAPVARIASVPLVVEAGPALPVRSIPELLAFARDRPGRLRVAFAGAGTPQHIAIARFQAMAGVTVTMVPYPGSAAALDDLLRGQVDAMFDPAPSSMPHIRAGRLVPLATTGPARSPVLPGVPALCEYIPGYAADSWFGLGAPRDTPERIVGALNAAINDALADPAVAAGLLELGATVAPCTPLQFRDFIAAETARYRQLIRAAGMQRG